MKVPILDLVTQHRPLAEDLGREFRRVVDSGRFILGGEVAAFEAELARYLGCAAAIGVGNCTDALTLALAGLELKPGDEVVTTPFTFVATAEVIATLGARPVFADIEPDTYNLDPTRVSEVITPRTRAILPVHLFGQSCALDELRALARPRGIAIVEDAAQALGAVYQGQRVGALTEVGCFSFYPSKNLSCLGDGGAIVTNQPELAERIRTLRIHGATRKYYHVRLGYNSRLDAVQAAFLRVKLPHLERWNEARRAHAAFYDRALAGLVTTPVVRAGNVPIYNQYTIRTPRRDELIRFLTEREIGTEVHYPLPLHLQPAFKELGYQAGDFPVAEQASREVVSLPIHPELTPEQLAWVADAVREFFARASGQGPAMPD